MGFFKKIFKPVSKVLDKIIPNEIKPALPYLAAFAPYMGGMQGIMGQGMMRRALMSGALNIGGQLSQEGSEGDINLLSAGLGALQGAMTAPGAASKFQSMKLGQTPVTNPAHMMGSDAAFFNTAGMKPDMMMGKDLNMFQKAANYGLEGLTKGSEFIEKMQGSDKFVDKLKLYTAPATQATGDLMYAQGQRDLKDLANEVVDDMGGGYSDDAYRAAIRKSMEAYGATEEEILESIIAAGYKSGGRVGLEWGGMPRAIQAVEEEETEWITQKPEWETVKRDLNNIFQESGGLQGDGMNAVGAYVKDNNLNYEWLLEGDEIKVKEKENMGEPVNLLDSMDGSNTVNINGLELLLNNKAKGGRVGMVSGGALKGLWNAGKTLFKGGDNAVDIAKQEELFRTGPITAKSLEEADNKMIKKFISTRDTGGIGGYGMYDDFAEMPAGLQAAELISRIKKKGGGIDYEAAEIFIGKKLRGNETIDELIAMVVKPQKIKKALGGRINKAEGGMPSVLPKGVEADYRGGGFIPIGSKERADDVPARLSENEFVMTADAVRAAGGGNVNKGAKRMYNVMNNLEARA